MLHATTQTQELLNNAAKHINRNPKENIHDPDIMAFSKILKLSENLEYLDSAKFKGRAMTKEIFDLLAILYLEESISAISWKAIQKPSSYSDLPKPNLFIFLEEYFSLTNELKYLQQELVDGVVLRFLVMTHKNLETSKTIKAKTPLLKQLKQWAIENSNNGTFKNSHALNKLINFNPKVSSNSPFSNIKKPDSYTPSFLKKDFGMLQSDSERAMTNLIQSIINS
tara:strand:- start:1226 stop:1900 length:675 start_codon:yes stop_codon:yes gene_type:complete